MKKILLASTILAGTAGFAAADNANFTFSGSAYTGIAFTLGLNEVAYGIDFNEDGDTTDTDAVAFTPEVSAEFTVGMMTTTDGGLEAGASVTVEGGSVMVESDHTEGNFGLREYNTDQVNYNGSLGTDGTVSSASVYVSGEWGKFSATLDGTTSVYDGPLMANATGLVDIAPDVDFAYDASFGDFDISVWYEYRYGQNNDEYGAQGTYNFGDYSIWAGVEYQEDIGVDGGYDAWVGASASMNGFTGEVEVNYEDVSDDFDWYAKVGYSMDAWSVGAIIEDDGIDDEFDFGVNASYDLGGGVSIDAAYIYDDDSERSVAKAGVSMSF